MIWKGIPTICSHLFSMSLMTRNPVYWTALHTDRWSGVMRLRDYEC